MARPRSGITSRGALDAIVVGAGVVGAATALGLVQRGMRVAVVEARAPRLPEADAPRDLRVFAFAPSSSRFLAQLGVWDEIRRVRAHPYRRMRVWDAGGGDELQFDAVDLGAETLGHIVEQSVLQGALWRALLGRDGIECLCPASVAGLEREGGEVRLVLDDGRTLRSRVAVAADGADSRLRELAGLETHGHPYAQRGLVAYVRCERPHEDTAWQRFTPGGPLALLPCDDGLGSIVWTLPEREAERLLVADEAAFADELTRAFGARLGAMRLASPRAAFPLRLQLAPKYVADRVVLVGDAAHVVHPLAGQGVNLGMQDAIELVATLDSAHRAGRDPGAVRTLRPYERVRRSENAIAARAFDGINRLFSNDAVIPTLLRGPALGFVDRIAPLKRWFARHAMGPTR